MKILRNSICYANWVKLLLISLVNNENPERVDFREAYTVSKSQISIKNKLYKIIINFSIVLVDGKEKQVR